MFLAVSNIDERLQQPAFQEFTIYVVRLNRPPARLQALADVLQPCHFPQLIEGMCSAGIKIGKAAIVRLAENFRCEPRDSDFYGRVGAPVKALHDYRVREEQ